MLEIKIEKINALRIDESSPPTPALCDLALIKSEPQDDDETMTADLDVTSPTSSSYSMPEGSVDWVRQTNCLPTTVLVEHPWETFPSELGWPSTEAFEATGDPYPDEEMDFFGGPRLLPIFNFPIIRNPL